MSALVCATPARYEPVFWLAASRFITATPGVTDCRVGPADDVHAPPTFAVPRPPVTVRLNVSLTIAGGPCGADTVTARVVVPVAPPLSVTVSVIVYVPAVA